MSQMAIGESPIIISQPKADMHCQKLLQEFGGHWHTVKRMIPNCTQEQAFFGWATLKIAQLELDIETLKKGR